MRRSLAPSLTSLGFMLSNQRRRGSLYSCCSTQWKFKNMKQTMCEFLQFSLIETMENESNSYTLCLMTKGCFPTVCFFCLSGMIASKDSSDCLQRWLDFWNRESLSTLHCSIASNRLSGQLFSWSLIAAWLDLPKEVHRKSLAATWLKRNITVSGVLIFRRFLKSRFNKRGMLTVECIIHWVWPPSQYSGKWKFIGIP